MADVLLKKIVTKMKRSDTSTAFERWSFLISAEKEKIKESFASKQKISAVSQIVDVCSTQQGFSMEKVGDLDLICVQLQSVKKQWSAYVLDEKLDSIKSTNFGTNPQKFHGNMKKLLQRYFTKDCCVSTMLYDGLLWGRVYIPRPGVRQYQAHRCLYFIHYPATPVIIFSGMKATYTQFLSQCLLVTLGYKHLKELNLAGHHYESLAELTFNKYSKGGLLKFQTNGTTSRKRKVAEVETDKRINDENTAEKRQRLEALEDKFGPNVQPILEKLEYRVQLPYKSRHVVPELRTSDQLFNSRVKFQGTNVLEGLRSLAEAGYATVPLPTHLTCVPSRPRNYFLLAKKQNATTASSQTVIQSQSVRETVNEDDTRAIESRSTVDVGREVRQARGRSQGDKQVSATSRREFRALNIANEENISQNTTITRKQSKQV